MNTTAAAQQVTTARTAKTPAGQRRKLRILGVIAVFLGVLAPALAVAQPAQAVGSISTQISFCAPSANYTTNLEIWNAQTGKYQLYKAGKSASNGCGTFRYVDAGYYYRVTQAVSVNTGWCRTSWTQVYATGYAQAVANRNVYAGELRYINGYTWC